MGIDLSVTTLWAELATWSPSAAEVILKPEYWAIHGATRMGKALTFDDRIADSAIDAAVLAEGVVRARGVKDLLAKANRTTTVWSEPPPPKVTSHGEALRALEGEHVLDVAGDAIERLVALAHALQAGAKLGEDASHDDVREVLASPPRVGPKPRGPFSALLAMSTNTIWVPMPLSSAWDAPSFIVASSVQLAEDLDALPPCLEDADERLAGDLSNVGALIEGFREALELAGGHRCVVMDG